MEKGFLQLDAITALHKDHARNADKNYDNKWRPIKCTVEENAASKVGTINSLQIIIKPNKRHLQQTQHLMLQLFSADGNENQKAIHLLKVQHGSLSCDISILEHNFKLTVRMLMVI